MATPRKQVIVTIEGFKRTFAAMESHCEEPTKLHAFLLRLNGHYAKSKKMQIQVILGNYTWEENGVLMYS